MCMRELLAAADAAGQDPAETLPFPINTIKATIATGRPSVSQRLVLAFELQSHLCNGPSGQQDLPKNVSYLFETSTSLRDDCAAA